MNSHRYADSEFSQKRKQGEKMRKVLFVLTMCFGLIAFGGCGGAATEKAKEGDPKKPAENAEKKEEKKAEPKFKAADNKPDEVVGIIDLVTSIVADKEGWEGKEVTVKGRVSGFSTSADLNTLTMKNDADAKNVGNTMACTTQGANLKDMLGKDVVVKGTVGRITDDSAWLKPCELKSQSGGDDKKSDAKDDKK